MAKNTTKEKIVQVKDLTISFRTNNGTLKAVRDVSFDLYKGETLAIVGESGSGKSVTSKSIMGILANNKIIENGEILYSGKDLLKISEEEFVKIRGSKIAMIFQDPMSSLNPIMRVGKQITESTLLKSKADVKEAKTILSKLKTAFSSVLENKKDYEIVEKYFSTTSKILKKKYEYEYGKYYLNKSESKLKDLIKLLTLKSLNNSNFYSSANDFLTYFEASFTEDVLKDDEEALRISKELSKIIELSDNQKIDVVDKKEDIKSMLNSLTESIKKFHSKKENDYKYEIFYEVLSNDDNKELSKKSIVDEFINKYKKIIKEAVKLLNDKYDLLAKGIFEKINDISNLKPYTEEKTEDFIADKKVYKKFKAFFEFALENENPLYLLKTNPLALYFPAVSGYLDSYFSFKKSNDQLISSSKKEYEKLVKENNKNGKKTESYKESVLKDNQPNIDAINKLTDNIGKYFKKVSNKEFDDEYNFEFIIESIDKYIYQEIASVDKSKARDKALELMREVGIPFPEKRFKQYPFEFSGGMRQRIVIAIAIASNPEVLICDEPTTALDVTIQSQILELINRLKEERNLSIIFITHDLGVVANMADRINVMYAGKIIEYGLADEIFYDSRHPYTWALLSSMPDINSKEKLEAIPGTPPNMIFPPKGDAFAARNKYAMKIDFEQQPPFFKITETHSAATWLLHPDAPKVEKPKIVLKRIKDMASLAQKDYDESGINIVDFKKIELGE